jgi:hypothetical protein
MDDMITPRGITSWDENGPHYYGPQRTWLGNVKQGVTPERAFDVLRDYAAPNQLRPVMNSGDVSDARLTVAGIPFWSFGNVEHHVFPEALTIVNTTLPGHMLYPGNVFRSIVRDGDDVYVETRGYGTGRFKKAEEEYGPDFWKYFDEQMRDRLNSPSVPTYNDAFLNTNATDIAEAGGNVYDAVRANQSDMMNAYRIYNDSLFGGNAPERPSFGAQ